MVLALGSNGEGKSRKIADLSLRNTIGCFMPRSIQIGITTAVLITAIN